MPHPSLPQNPLHLPGAQRPPSPTKGITGIRISTSTMEKLGDPTRPGPSPNSPDGDRKRRRSPSPFEHRSPRPRYRSASHSPDRSRSPSPSAIPATSFYSRTAHPIHSRSGQGQVPTPPGAVEHAVTFKNFTEWLRGAWPKLVYRDEDDRGSSAMGKRYEAYRKVYYHRQLVSLFLAHRESAWFIERYSEVKTHVATRKRLNREGRVPRARSFLEALGRGDFDSVSYDQEPINNGEASRYKSPEVIDDDGEERSRERETEEMNGNGSGNGHSNGAELDDRISAEAGPNQLFVKTIPPSAARKDLEKMFRGVKGLRYLAISEPSPKKSYHRVAWAQYAEGTDMEAAVKATDGQQIDSFTYHVVHNVTPAIGKQRLTAQVANTLPRLERDLHLARELAKKLEAELLFDATIDGEELEGLDGSVWEKVEERIMSIWMREGLEAEDILDDVGRARRTRLALDQYLHYLRKGLNTCYYCVAPLSHSESLNRHCISHVRPREGTVAPEPEVEGRKTQDQRWIETLESKLCLVVETGDEGDLKAFTKRHHEEEIRRLCAPLIRQESANKYACTECNKMFKAPEYVIKHLPTKHRELMADVLEQISYFHAFVMDPNKISPQPGTPASISLAIPKPSYATGHTHHAVPMASRSAAQPMSGAWNPAKFPGIVPPRPAAPAPLPLAGNEDPRAKRGRVSYMDLDEDVAGGQEGLPY